MSKDNFANYFTISKYNFYKILKKYYVSQNSSCYSHYLITWGRYFHLLFKNALPDFMSIFEKFDIVIKIARNNLKFDLNKFCHE